MANRISAHPGGFIKRNYIDELDITAAQLAEALGINKATMSRLLNEKSDLSPQLAMRVSKVLGGSPGSWMNMQANHSLAKLEAGTDINTDAWVPTLILKNGKFAEKTPAKKSKVSTKVVKKRKTPTSQSAVA
jgi:addiction module HigA family antidote